MTAINNFVHILIMVEDLQIAHQFYSTVFSWKIAEYQQGANQLHFQIADGEFMSGSLVKPEQFSPNTTHTLFISVDNLERLGVLIEAEGGKIVEQIYTQDEFPGRMMQIEDPFGNRFGLWSDS